MRFIIRTVMLIALVWIGLLLSGYGVLIGSKENAAGLGLQCTYLTARGTSTVQYLHTKSGFLGITGNDSNLLIVFYVQIMPDDFVMQLHRF
ncbi:YobH family protein [Escherichia coli]|nr:YobH family protein [Escherichia coli]